MEATKKKKAYLKPEMSRLDMKVESSFLLGSKDEIIITPEQPDVDWTVGWLEEQCTQDGVAKSLPVGGQTCFRANKNDYESCRLFYELGAKTGKGKDETQDIIKLTRISQEQYRAEFSPIMCETITEVPEGTY